MDTIRSTASAVSSIGKKISGKTFGKSIQTFLLEKDLLPLSLAIYIGTVLQKFLEKLVNGLIMPSLKSLTPKPIQDIGNNKFLKDNGFDLKGVFNHTLSLIIAIIISYFLVRYVVEKMLD